MGLRVATTSLARHAPFIWSAVAAAISFGAMKLAGNAHIDDCYATATAPMTETTTNPTADPAQV